MNPEENREAQAPDETVGHGTVGDGTVSDEPVSNEPVGDKPIPGEPAPGERVEDEPFGNGPIPGEPAGDRQFAAERPDPEPAVRDPRPCRPEVRDPRPGKTAVRTGPIVWGCLVLVFCAYVAVSEFTGGAVDTATWIITTVIGLGALLLVVAVAVLVRGGRDRENRGGSKP